MILKSSSQIIPYSDTLSFAIIGPSCSAMAQWCKQKRTAIKTAATIMRVVHFMVVNIVTVIRLTESRFNVTISIRSITLVINCRIPFVSIVVRDLLSKRVRAKQMDHCCCVASCEFLFRRLQPMRATKPYGEHVPTEPPPWRRYGPGRPTGALTRPDPTRLAQQTVIYRPEIDTLS